MAISAQDKMIYVANKLGLSTLKNMQGSTRVIYDQSITAALDHTLFAGSAQRNFPLTNLGANGNQFQVDEALLIEQIGFLFPMPLMARIMLDLGLSVKFDLVIGNKTVIKDCVVEQGGQQAFYNDGTACFFCYYFRGRGYFNSATGRVLCASKCF
jgi:hypothetical protein